MSAARPSPATSAPARAGLLLVGTILVAFNLRFAITSVGPVIDDVRDDLSLSGAAAGLLTTLPLLALGLAAPLGPPLSRRLGAERVVLGCLLAIAAGIALRLPHSTPLMFAGTVVAGCGIAVANVLVPSIVKHRFGPRAPVIMGVYAGALSAGAALATGLTVPIEDAANGSWRIALAAWAIPALIAAVVWLPQTSGRGDHAVPTTAPVALWRDRLAWDVTILMGLQSLMFYAVIAWLPDVLHDHGVSSGTAGGLVAGGLIIGIVASPILSWMASRTDDQRGLLLLTLGTTAAGLLGVIVAAGSVPALWVSLLGFGQGGIFALVMTIIVLRSPDSTHAAQLSSMSQSVGYTVAALGPLLVGALHDASGSWTLPLAVVLALAIPETFAGLRAAKPGYVGSSDHTNNAITPNTAPTAHTPSQP